MTSRRSSIRSTAHVLDVCVEIDGGRARWPVRPARCRWASDLWPRRAAAGASLQAQPPTKRRAQQRTSPSALGGRDEGRGRGGTHVSPSWVLGKASSSHGISSARRSAPRGFRRRRTGAAEHRRRIHDDDRRTARIRIDVDQVVDRISRPVSSRASRTAAPSPLAAIHVPARKHPSRSRARWRGGRGRAVALVADDRPDGNLRVEIEDEPAARADQPLGLGRLSERGSRPPPHSGQKL